MFFMGLSVLPSLFVEVPFSVVVLFELADGEGVGLTVTVGVAVGFELAGLCSLMNRVICDCAFLVHWLMLS